ncbi:MAG TPA: hypothetical protein VGC54_09565 [Planctomycetota bacterium]
MLREVVDYLMLVAHVVGAVLGLGGAAYLLMLLPAAVKLGGEPGRQLMAQAAARFKTLGIAATWLLLLSGGHLTFARGHFASDHALLLGVKIILAIAVIGMWHASSAQAERAAQAEGGTEPPLRLLRISLLLAFVALAIGTWISTGFAEAGRP